MGKKPEAKVPVTTKKAGRASKPAVQTITVVDGNKTPHEELMKLPKAHIVKDMAIPENKTRFMVDVNNQTKKGQRIIALMESLRDGDTTAIKKVTQTLDDLATPAAKKPTPGK